MKTVICGKEIEICVANEKRENQIRLQGIGWQPAVKAIDLRPGDITVWNYGFKETVKSVEKSKSGKTVSIVTECESGYVGTRNFKANRLVGIA